MILRALKYKYYVYCFIALFSEASYAQHISGELKEWHNITLTFDGPEASEDADPNPFSDYRLTVTFSHGTSIYRVPGYFAADGNASESGVTSGNKWRVHFAPPEIGTWEYIVSFVQGTDVAVTSDGGMPMFPDGVSGQIEIAPSDKSGTDLRGKGRLQYVNARYLRHQGNEQYFLKVGADSPETLLAYQDFDQTYLLSTGAPLKSWSPHLGDWMEGDPTWSDTLGKGLIGAINYLSAEGQNAISFLTMNIDGDGDNVWPYADPEVYDRFDCSKLDQWEIVFAHCDKKGLFLHIKTQEQENDQLLDGGELGRMRKLYYRELIARFSHHLALNWNLGEENTNTDIQQRAFATYIRENDPYQNHIVVHTFPGSGPGSYAGLLGNQSELTGISLQTEWDDVHGHTLEWIKACDETGKPWVVANDEQGIAFVGVPDDAFTGNPTQKDIRSHVLWGNLMAGGAGVEYYFGYALPQNDLNCEDFRSRDRMWDFNRYAVAFFQTYLPFWMMQSADTLIQTKDENAYCFALRDSVYAIYLANVQNAAIDLTEATGQFEILWFHPSTGGPLVSGSTQFAFGGNLSLLGLPPDHIADDWVVLLRKKSGIPEFATLDCAPASCNTVRLFWRQDIADGSPVIVEYSIDGSIFNTLATFTSAACPGICSRVLPAVSEATYYRLRLGIQFSNIVKCELPCFAEGSPAILSTPHLFLSRQD